ncbi:MAG: methyltransferase domain-containing protein [Verrucomicrobiaceae bacterium]|nr:methyltransferase domain-containing protein [Verrucomicrobiaceae bacterium]
MQPQSMMVRPQFPRAAKYHPGWITAGVSGAANPLWMAEWLAEVVDLQPGMRVLDLGCGRAMSSVFLHREFGVQVWAADLWFDVSENSERIRDAGCADGVFPIHADARALPFARDFFDAIISIDSFPYYGTDEMYLPYLARLVKPGGVIAIAGAAVVQEWEGAVPAHLRDWWTPDLSCLHSAVWWRKHWARSGILTVEHADTMPEGCKLWRDWIQIIAPDNQTEIQALEADQGRHLGYVRVVGRRDGRVVLPDPVLSLPPAYVKHPLLQNHA